jgi:predicted phosphohydrolase
MDIFYISDLHLEFIDDYKKYIDAIFNIDEKNIILVLAGDICSYNYFYKLEYCFDIVSKFSYVIFVPGNHEYYSEDKVNMDVIDDELKKLIDAYSNIYYLNNDIMYIDNYKFIGSILWTKVNDEDINDFKYIYLNDETLTKDKYNYLHNDCKEYLDENVKDSMFDTIVITHHVPSLQLIHPSYKIYKSLNQYFNVDMEYLFENVKYWICGHTHKKMIKEINGCKVMINPIGYPKENYKVKVEKVI